MIYRITNTKEISLDKSSAFGIQNGGAPIGSTTVGNYPVNVSDFNEEHPNQFLKPSYPGSTVSYHSSYNYPLVKVNQILTDRSSYATLVIEPFYEKNWYKHKFKSGDQLCLQRWNVKRFFTIKSVTVNSLVNIHLLNDRNYQSDVFSELDHFISESGYPDAENCYINFVIKLETNLRDENLQDFYIDFNEYQYTDSFSLKAFWETSPEITSTAIRWRSVPDNLIITSDISFVINYGGRYYLNGLNGLGPFISLISDTGRSAAVEVDNMLVDYLYSEPVGYITSVALTNLGGGYLQSPSVTIDATNQVIGQTGSMTANLTLQTEGRVDYIKVLDGGAGYTGASVSVSSVAPYGTTAYGYAEIEDGTIKNIVLTDRGYGFTYGTASNSTVILTPFGSGSGASLSANVDIMSEWNYELPTPNAKTSIINGFKRGIKYEIQILCISDQKAYSRYSNSINFCYL